MEIDATSANIINSILFVYGINDDDIKVYTEVMPTIETYDTTDDRGKDHVAVAFYDMSSGFNSMLTGMVKATDVGLSPFEL